MYFEYILGNYFNAAPMNTKYIYIYIYIKFLFFLIRNNTNMQMESILCV